MPNKMLKPKINHYKVFSISHRVYFNETNAVGGVAYFSNYVKWQGIAREEYFIQTVPSWREIMKIISSGQLNMVTIEEHSHFIQHAYFGDQVTIDLQTSNIKKYSFDMFFWMVNAKNEILYEGLQRLAFDDFHGRFIEIPEPMLRSVQQHQIDSSNGVIKFRKLRKYILASNANVRPHAC